MRKALALVLCTLLPVFGMAGVGLAQSSVQVQGTIQSVDCQSQTAVLSGGGGTYTVAATASTTVLVNSTRSSFCTLQQYVGAPATAWVFPSGNQFLLARIDVTGPAASTSPAVSSPSTAGLVLGAIAVGVIGYLIGRSTASQPQPEYQPYNQPYYYNQNQPYYNQPYPYQGGRWGPRPGRYYGQCDARTWTSQWCSNPEPGSKK